jgi:hypothetical protein
MKLLFQLYRNNVNDIVSRITHIDQIRIVVFRLGLAFDGGGDVMIAIGSLILFKFAQALIETFNLFPPVNIFNL